MSPCYLGSTQYCKCQVLKAGAECLILFTYCFIAILNVNFISHLGKAIVWLPDMNTNYYNYYKISIIVVVLVLVVLYRGLEIHAGLVYHTRPHRFPLHTWKK